MYIQNVDVLEDEDARTTYRGLGSDTVCGRTHCRYRERLMIIMVPCYACKRRGVDTGWRTSNQRSGTAAACGVCRGTGQMSVEETLPCSKCRLDGKLDSSLVFQDAIGRLMIWRCSFGHDWTKVGGAIQDSVP